MSTGKRIKNAREGIERTKLYPLGDAVKLVKKRAKAKFDETVEIAMNLGVDPKHADQMVRGTVVLPHGLGKSKRVLGPRGLMPNPKAGTVTFDVGRAVREAKAGKVEFRVDKAGNIHVPVGKRSFSTDKLAANAMALIEAIVRAKPAAAKGTYLRTLTVSSTMSPGVKIDAQGVANLFKKTAV